MTGTAGSYTPPAVFGQANMAAPFYMPTNPVSVGTWYDTGLFVDLPGAGTWEIAADVTGHLNFTTPTGGMAECSVAGRLYNVTAAAAIPASFTELVAQSIHQTDPLFHAWVTACSPIHRFVTVTGPSRIRVESSISIFSSTAPDGKLNFAIIGQSSRLAYKRVA